MRFLFTLLRDSFSEDRRVVHVPPAIPSLGEAFRADAKAEGQTIVIGGWETLGGCRPHDARWFSVRLDRKSASWAYARGDPFRTIAALELYGTLLCVMLFGDRWPQNARGRATVSGYTDNAGNAALPSRLMTSRFPLVVVLAELAEQLRARAWT